MKRRALTNRLGAEKLFSCPHCGSESLQSHKITIWPCPYCGHVDISRNWRRGNETENKSVVGETGK